MKNLITIINLSIIIGITTIFTQSDRIKQEGKAQITNTGVGLYPTGIKKTIQSDFTTEAQPPKEKPTVDDATVGFIREMAEARLMDLEEGKTASQRSTTRALKDYGSLMVKDQTKMLEDLRKIAELKNVTIPSWLGPEKAQGLEDLKKVHGKSFDKKFIRMMTIDHKRDVQKFEKATQSGDADVQVFATKYLPVVQAHLDKIKTLKKNN